MHKGGIIIKKLFLSIAIISILFSNLCLVNATSKTKREQIYDNCYNNMDNVTIEDKEGRDITVQEKDTFIYLYKNKSYKDITNYLNNNIYSISVIFKNNSRSFEGKTFEKIYTITSSTTFKHYEEQKKISITYGLIVSANYTMNVNTGKVSNTYDPTISLENNYVLGDTGALKLTALDNTANPYDNNWKIKLHIKYKINTKYTYYPYESIIFGPYEKNIYITNP